MNHHENHYRSLLVKSNAVCLPLSVLQRSVPVTLDRHNQFLK